MLVGVTLPVSLVNRHRYASGVMNSEYFGALSIAVDAQQDQFN
jgi:hypothetical protein